jgi:hypothetical protein
LNCWSTATVKLAASKIYTNSDRPKTAWKLRKKLEEKVHVWLLNKRWSVGSVSVINSTLFHVPSLFIVYRTVFMKPSLNFQNDRDIILSVRWNVNRSTEEQRFMDNRTDSIQVSAVPVTSLMLRDFLLFLFCFVLFNSWWPEPCLKNLSCGNEVSFVLYLLLLRLFCLEN